MSEKTESKKKPNIHTSYVGAFKPDSFKIEDGVASATFIAAGGNEYAVKGYNAHAKTLEEAVKAGGEDVIIRGSILGAGNTKHMAMYGTGPELVTGKVSNVRDNFDSYEKDGKQPYVNMFVLMERGEHKIGRPLVAYGDEALALKGVSAGDTIEAPARQTHESREVTNKETGEKENSWSEVMRVTGAGTFKPAEPAPEDSKKQAEPEENSPAM